ncbi:MAG: hypothetical protein H7A44_02180 [Opitutaceae bacterium]|nr:hypothetical protein [Opitutaceae bacterium]
MTMSQSAFIVRPIRHSNRRRATNSDRLARRGDRPFTETKEQIGDILIIEARDQNHAVELISKHPGVTFGPWAIRPAADLGEMIRASEIRRGKA